MTKIIGIDPGLSGAIAYLTPDDLQIWDMPTLDLVRGGKKKREIDEIALADILEDLHGKVFLEKVGAMPGQGVSSMFSFGQSYGVIRGIIAAYQMQRELVPPATWKAKLKVRKGKDAARLRASELMPKYSGLWPLKKHDGRAEAALIAYYGSMAPRYAT